MKIFLVHVDNWNHDEYDSFIIRAFNEERARQVALDIAYGRGPSEQRNLDRQKWATAHVEELVSEGPEEMLLASYEKRGIL